MSWTVTAFYKFVSIEDPTALRGWILELCVQNDVVGTILVAHEGINGTIAGSATAIATVLTELRSDVRIGTFESKKSHAVEKPFQRLKVKLKREIVTLGQPAADPNRQVGAYVEPKDWNALIASDDVLAIDTRNAYEVKIGTFEGAIDPQTKTFREFPQWVRTQLDPAKHRRIAMFCTGGIRCEKATAYLLAQGFEEVYHLKGGILKYLEEVPAEQSLWRGECFVFDERVALAQGIELGTHVMCRRCGFPVSRAALVANGAHDGYCESCRARDTISPKAADQARS